MANSDDSSQVVFYPPYRTIHGEGEEYYRYMIVPNPRWTEIQKIVLAGHNKSNSIMIDTAIDNMNSIGYEQMLQNRCKDMGIDPCLAMAIIIVVSGGDPNVRGGLFGIGGVDIEAQITNGLKRLLVLKEKYQKGDNLIGWVQSFRRWSEDMDIANKENAEFDKDWVGAMKHCGFSMDDMSFFPAVMNAYEILPAKRTASSQVTSSSANGAEFPFKTTQLNNIYLVKDHGITNYGGGVVTSVNGAVFQIVGSEPVYSPVRGSANMVDGELVITSFDTGIKYVFNGIKNPISSGGEEVIVGSQIGTCSDKLVVKCYGTDGYALDPYTQWGLLQGKISPNMSKSIGKFIEEESLKYG